MGVHTGSPIESKILSAKDSTDCVDYSHVAADVAEQNVE